MARRPGLKRIAREALPAMREAWSDYVAENGDEDDSLDGCELYLYVYGSGAWIIDHAQYLQDHRDIYSQASLGDYTSIDQLYHALQEGVDWA